MSEQLFNEYPIPFAMIKQGSLEVPSGNPNRWVEKIEKYMNEKYPHIASNMRPLKFSKQDASNGTAVGTIPYKDGNLSLTIPIIISDFKLKEPDIAFKGEDIIPLDEEYLSTLRSEDGGGGKLIDQGMEEEDEKGDYISSIFETTETNPDGTVTHYKAGSTRKTVDAVKKAMLRFPKKEVFKDTLEKLNKTACVDDNIDIVSTVYHELEDKPFHYNGSLLKRAADGSLTIERVTDAKIADFDYKSNVFGGGELDEVSAPLYADSEKAVKDIKDKKYKLVKKDGTYDIIIAGEQGKNETNVKGGFERVEDGNTSKNFLATWEKTDPENRKADNPQFWMYNDKIYGSYISDHVYLNGIVDEYARRDDGTLEKRHLMNRVILFKIDEPEHKPKYSSLYKVTAESSFKLGPEGEEVSYLDVISLDTNLKMRFWLNQSVENPHKANNDKIKDNEYAPLWWEHPIYLIPQYWDLKVIEGTRKQPGDVKTYAEKELKKQAEAYTGEFRIVKSIDGLRDQYDIEVKDSDKTTKYAELDNDDALLYTRYYMGQDIEKIADLELGPTYNVQPKPKALVSPSKTAEVLDKYRGEFLKLAYYLNRSSKTRKSLEKYKKAGYSLKLAEPDNLINQLIDNELFDNGDINVGDVKQSLEKTLNTVGRLLLVARMGKIDANEGVLSRALRGIVKVLNEVRGTIAPTA